MKAAACTCAGNWATIRVAMNLTAKQFADVLGTSIRSVWNHERTGVGHHCMSVASQRLLRAYLFEHADALTAKGIAYPWPNDLAPVPIDPGPLCERCGIPKSQHRKCLGCGFLLGDGHRAESAISDLCEVCADLYERRAAHANAAVAV